MGGALSRAVAEACAALRPVLAADTGAKVGDVLTRLDGPLQLAIAGRIKSGKSAGPVQSGQSRARRVASRTG